MPDFFSVITHEHSFGHILGCSKYY